MPQSITLPEAAGSRVADLLEHVTGQRPYGITIPGLPPVYFSPPSACLRVHEDVHVAQEERDGPIAFDRRYLDQLVRCMLGHKDWDRRAAFVECDRHGVDYEVEAYEAMHACMAIGGVAEAAPTVEIGRLLFLASDLKAVR